MILGDKGQRTPRPKELTPTAAHQSSEQEEHYTSMSRTIHTCCVDTEDVSLYFRRGTSLLDHSNRKLISPSEDGYPAWLGPIVGSRPGFPRMALPKSGSLKPDPFCMFRAFAANSVSVSLVTNYPRPRGILID